MKVRQANEVGLRHQMMKDDKIGMKSTKFTLN